MVLVTKELKNGDHLVVRALAEFCATITNDSKWICYELKPSLDVRTNF